MNSDQSTPALAHVRLLAEALDQIGRAKTPAARVYDDTIDAAALHAALRACGSHVLAMGQVVLPRLLRFAPTQDELVEVSKLATRTYGGGDPERSHLASLGRLLESLGAAAASSRGLPSELAIAYGVETWADALVCVLAERASGALVAGLLVRSLTEKYRISEHALLYFNDLAEHGAADCRLIFRMIEKAVVSSDRDLVATLERALRTLPELLRCSTITSPRLSFVSLL